MILLTLIAHLFFAAAMLPADTAGRDSTIVSVDAHLADSLRQLGQAAYAEGKFERAIDYLGRAAHDSSDAKSEFFLGLSLASINDISGSLRHLHNAVRADSLNSGHRFQYGRMLELASELSHAQREYGYIVRHDSAYLPAYFQLGVLLCNQKAYGIASPLFTHLLRIRENDFLSSYYLGMCLAGAGLKDSAARYLALAITINGAYAPALVALASLYSSDGSFDNALRLYNRAIALQPDAADLYFKAASCRLKLHDEAGALDPARRAAELDTTTAAYIAQLGYVYLLAKRYDSALIAYKKAIALERDEPTYYINLALTYSKIDSSAGAIDAYEKAIVAYKPENVASVHIRLGTLYYYLGRFRDAATSYQHALEIDPPNKEARFYLALAYDRLNESRSAVRQYRKYLQLAVHDTAAAERQRMEQARDRIDHLTNR